LLLIQFHIFPCPGSNHNSVHVTELLAIDHLPVYVRSYLRVTPLETQKELDRTPRTVTVNENLKVSLAQTSDMPKRKGFYRKQLRKGFIVGNRHFV
jgi:hypothetical protein